MRFPCTLCGACCKRSELIPILDPSHPLFFPYKYNENGKCEMLTEDNLCSVYEHRPIICNIDALAKIFKFTKKEFYNMNKYFCNEFMDEDNLPLKFRIK